MHLPDGAVGPATAAVAAAVAAGGVGVALRRARHQLSGLAANKAGLVSAALLVLQLPALPVGFGTSAHLVGAVLAATLVGPAAAVCCGAVVILLQTLLLGDGGVTALGLNVVNDALVPVVAGSAVLRAVVAVAGRSRLAAAAAAGGAVSVLASAAAFAVEYRFGGSAALDAGHVAAGMLLAHAGVAAVEAVVTYGVVGAVTRHRPAMLAPAWRRPPPARGGAARSPAEAAP